MDSQPKTEMSKAERLLSYSLLSLITSRPLSSPPTNTGVDEENYVPKAKSLINSEGAWCWREGCQGALSATISIFVPSLNGRLFKIDQGNAEDLGDASKCCGLV